jgi:hypothetical protein
MLREETRLIIGTFLFYFILFLFVFSSPGKLKGQNRNFKRILVLPAVVALILATLTVLKVYFIYKIFLLLFGGFIFLLSYWQWGGKIRRWFGF